MKSARIAALLAGVFALSLPVFGQSPQPAQPPAPTVQQQNEDILRELKAIRALLESVIAPPRRPPATARITNLSGQSLGSADAPLTMVEFTDLQCPYCRQFAVATFDEIKKNWIDTGKLRYVTRDYPLDFHPQAMPAARAARCAGEQGKFWDMRLALVRNANLLSADYIRKTAADLKLDAAAFSSCAASSKYDAEIRADMQEGARLGIDGTPMFVIGRTTPGGIEGPMIVGALPYAQFEQRLRDLLK